MFLKLICSNTTDQSVNETLFTELLTAMSTHLQPVPQKEVELLLTDNETIQRLNRDYRDKDKPTDVLSFNLDDPATLGQIVISLPQAAAQARDLGQSLDEELRFLFTHGMLHLLGYDHETPQEEAEMLQKAYAILGRPPHDS